MDIVTEFINMILNNFDLSYCLVVNVATFIIIKVINALVGAMKGILDYNVGTWTKRIVLIAIILLTGVLYHPYIDARILINSAILAPVSWSWIFKPICKLLRIDYNKAIDNKEDGEK